ncbi:hypothetical protein FQA47_025498 [Oryzias melastigma]|uniref:Uncharacterized protein n=1 Tax=Oryzias melastigma TaxID=30732 RepID=A0A834C561_ORYME|nr:hypothetical protein FQA47_025498 [Oryzias melastigma]
MGPEEFWHRLYAADHIVSSPRGSDEDGAHGLRPASTSWRDAAELSRAARFTDRGRHPVTALPGTLRHTLRQTRTHEHCHVQQRREDLS